MSPTPKMAVLGLSLAIVLCEMVTCSPIPVASSRAEVGNNVEGELRQGNVKMKGVITVVFMNSCSKNGDGQRQITIEKQSVGKCVDVPDLSGTHDKVSTNPGDAQVAFFEKENCMGTEIDLMTFDKPKIASFMVTGLGMN